MNTRRQLLQSVIDDLDDVSRQLIFADYVEEHGDTALAEYVRLNVELQQLPAEAEKPAEYQRQKHLTRKLSWLLHQHPACWQWDNVLALSNLPSPRNSLWRKANVVKASVLHQLADRLQHELPVGYQMWLQKVSNGQPKSKRKGTLYSAERIIEELARSPTYHRNAMLPCELHWEHLPSIYYADERLLRCSTDSEINALAHRLENGEHEDCPGLLRIGEFFQSYYYLVLNGDLRGAIWCTGSYGAETLYFTTPRNSLAEADVQHPQPLDTVSCLFSIATEPAFFRF